MKPVHRNRRLLVAGGAASLLAGAAALVFVALESSVSYFYAPADLATLETLPTETIRLGGLVAEGSIKRGPDLHTEFRVTDGVEEYRVVYKGILPDLFREGQGVIAHGRFLGGDAFTADTILAKHDENYIPKELADTIAS